MTEPTRPYQRHRSSKFKQGLIGTVVVPLLVCLVGAVMVPFVIGWPSLSHWVEGPVYEVQTSTANIGLESGTEVAVAGYYSDRTSAPLTGISCQWGTTPTLKSPIIAGATECTAEIVATKADFAKQPNQPIDLELKAWDPKRPDLSIKPTHITLYPVSKPEIIAEPTLEYSGHMDVRAAVESTVGLQETCEWQPASLFQDAHACRTVLTAPSNQGYVPTGTLAISVSVIVSKPDYSNDALMRLDAPGFTIRMTEPGAQSVGRSATRSPEPAPPPRFEAPRAAATPPTPAPPALQMMRPATSASRATGVAALLQMLDGSDGRERYLRLGGSLAMLDGSRVSTADVLALLDGIEDQRMRLDAIQSWLLPVLSVPISAEDAARLLGQMQGDDRVDLLTLLRPCISEQGAGGQISPDGRQAILAGAAGAEWRVLNRALEPTAAPCIAGAGRRVQADLGR